MNTILKILTPSIFLLLMVACEESNEIIIDEEFESYVEEFVVQAERRDEYIRKEMNDFSISFVNTEGDIAGQCIHYKNGKKEIRINKIKWSRMNKHEKELLLFHELGHCILERAHMNESDRYGKCISIMRESTTTCVMNYNSATKNNYLNELFK